MATEPSSDPANDKERSSSLPPSPPRAPSSWPATWASYRWPITLIALALIVLAAFKFSGEKASKELRDWRDTSVRAVSKGLDKTGEIAARFKSGTITKTFLSAIPEITETGQGVLELATAQAVETFRTEDIKLVAWDWINLGTTVAEIQVPVTYRYHLRLDDPWRLDVSNHTCIVIAPRIRPSQPPAIHTDQMEKRFDSGWARFNASDQMEELERSITPRLKVRARDSRHIDLVRENCRKSVAEFVRNWLLKEDHWRRDRFSVIQVYFDDEIPEDLTRGLPAIEPAAVLN